MHVASRACSSRSDTCTGMACSVQAAARRGGLALALRALAASRRYAALLERHGGGPVTTALCGSDAGSLDEADASALYECLVGMHVALGAAAQRELHRVEWLLNRAADEACWSGVQLVRVRHGQKCHSWRALRAPNHLGVFALDEPLRVVEDPWQRPAQTCNLATVRVARVLMELLRCGYLPFNRLGREFVDRVNTITYAKYERAAERIEQRELVPFGNAVGVPYVPGAVYAARLATDAVLAAMDE